MLVNIKDQWRTESTSMSDLTRHVRTEHHRIEWEEVHINIIHKEDHWYKKNAVYRTLNCNIISELRVPVRNVWISFIGYLSPISSRTTTRTSRRLIWLGKRRQFVHVPLLDYKISRLWNNNKRNVVNLITRFVIVYHFR